MQSPLCRELKKYFNNAEIINISTNPNEDAAEKLLSKLKNHDNAVIFSYNATHFPAQAGCINKILEIIPGAAVIAARSPYDIRVLKNVKNYICMYEQIQPAVEAVTGMLKGDFVPSGKPPVDILKGMYAE
jgi:hypothetical protein